MDIAFDYAEFFRRKRYSRERRDICVELLAEFFLAKIRRETGANELRLLAEAMGPDDYKDFESYQERLPHLQQAARIEDYLNGRGVQIPPDHTDLRSAMESLPVSNPTYANRMADGRELTDAESVVIRQALSNDYAAVRAAMAKEGPNALAALDNWISGNIDQQIEFLRRASAAAAASRVGPVP